MARRAIGVGQFIYAGPDICPSRHHDIADLPDQGHLSEMRWGLLALSSSLIAVAMLVFSSPSSPAAIGIGSLGVLLLIDWSWEPVIGHAAWGVETRKDKIVADFYNLENARWRYALAIIVSGALALSFSLSGSEKLQAAVLVGGYALCGVAGFASTMRSRRRVLRGG